MDEQTKPLCLKCEYAHLDGTPCRIYGDALCEEAKAEKWIDVSEPGAMNPGANE